MASDSLGTMTVGVTANVSDAERALNSLANMLEKFDRQQQTRARSASSGSRGAGAGGGGYFSPMSEEFNAEIRRMEMVQKRTESTLRFRQIRQSEMAAVYGRGTEENMRAIGEAFKSGDIERLEGVLGRANRGLQQVGDTSARTRYAVLNLGYGVQDAVTVFGTSGFAGAIRASANNLQGLGILLDKTAGGMAGLKSALMSGEFIIMGVATAVLLAASAWEKYSKSVEEALAKESAERFKNLKPERAVEQAGREEVLNRELARMEKLTEAEAKRKKAVDDLAAANAKLNAAGREEAATKAMIAKLQKEIEEFDRIRFNRAGAQRPAGRDADVPRMNAEEAALVRRVQERGGRAKLVSDLADLQKKMDDFAKGSSSPEAMLKDRDALQKELDAITKRVAELQPDEVSNAFKKLQALEAQAKVLDDQIKKQQESTDQSRAQYKTVKDQFDLIESGRAKVMAMNEEIRRRTTSLGTPKGIREKPEYQLTEAEKAVFQQVYPANLADMVAAGQKEVEQGQKTTDELRKQREKLAKDIAALQEKYPQFSPKEALLEMQQSDMEYRVAFLSKKRREVESRMRLGNQFTGVAQFESSTAYESLARSRMGPSAESDTLKRILAAEEKATAALEDIREKLDPGRRERLVILESFE